MGLSGCLALLSEEWKHSNLVYFIKNEKYKSIIKSNGLKDLTIIVGGWVPNSLWTFRKLKKKWFFTVIWSYLEGTDTFHPHSSYIQMPPTIRVNINQRRKQVLLIKCEMQTVSMNLWGSLKDFFVWTWSTFHCRMWIKQREIDIQSIAFISPIFHYLPCVPEKMFL